MDTSWFHPYVALLKVLHKNKVIHIDDVVRELGDTIDFADLKKMDQPERRASVAVYESMRQIAEALARAQK